MDYSKTKAEVAALLIDPTKADPKTLKALTHKLMDLLKCIQSDLKSLDPKLRDKAREELFNLKTLLEAAREDMLSRLGSSREPALAQFAEHEPTDSIYREAVEELKEFSHHYLGLSPTPPEKPKLQKRSSRPRISA